ncbi:MAG TPA: VWA domain-containing protein, partial [Pyrinomonadaceae bacterium]|nr:VWA domain-containing protein [Pyrinomonadaceae bacterium]
RALNTGIIEPVATMIFSATIRLLLTTLLFTFSAAAVSAQSCVTPDDIKQMLARIEAPPPAKVDKKYREELLKMAEKQRELLLEVVDKDQAKESDRDKLHKLYEKNMVKLCQLIKTAGWPTTALVDRAGVFAAFIVLKNGTYELQRDLLPVIVAAIKKDPSQKPEFAGVVDRLRVSAGLKQIFGTQAVSTGGFLILYPIEDEAKVNARRAEFGLREMDAHIRDLERTYGKPLVKARQPPNSQLSTPLKESLAKALDATSLDGNEVDAGDVIRVETSLVNLNVSVFNNKSKLYVGALTKDDFRVMENGEEQKVSYFASTDVPFDLVLLIDLSGSTKDKRDLIKQSTLRFIEAARPADRLAIVTFSDQAKLISLLTLDRAQLVTSVQNMEGTGGSHVWDAVKYALDEVIGPKTTDRRRAVVLMSDGVDGSVLGLRPPYSSTTTFADLIQQVRHTDTLLVPIYLDTQRGNPYQQNAHENARRALSLLASESGGSYYTARKISDLNGVYEQVINDLGKVYSLGYRSTNASRDNTWRWVQVVIPNKPDLVARSRPGYYAQ